MSQGKVHSIHITPTAGAPTQAIEQVHAVPWLGLQGDRYFGPSEDKRPGGGREITLIELEAIQAAAQAAGVPFGPGDSRRNIVTQGVSLNDLVGQEFQRYSAKMSRLLSMSCWYCVSSGPEM